MDHSKNECFVKIILDGIGCFMRFDFLCSATLRGTEENVYIAITVRIHQEESESGKFEKTVE